MTYLKSRLALEKVSSLHEQPPQLTIVAGQLREDIVMKLSPYNFQSKHYTHRERRVKDTGRWFLEEEAFQNWSSTGDSTTLLWCTGIGMG